MSEDTDEIVETEEAAPTTQRCPIQQEVCIEFDLVVAAKCDNIQIKCQ